MTHILQTLASNEDAKKNQMLPVLILISEFRNEQGRPPSLRQIADYFPNPSTKNPASLNTVSQWLNKMVALAWITKAKKEARSINITPTGLKILEEALNPIQEKQEYKNGRKNKSTIE
jgi:hypothetical protein